jgi:hypothetical protein
MFERVEVTRNVGLKRPSRRHQSLTHQRRAHLSLPVGHFSQRRTGGECRIAPLTAAFPVANRDPDAEAAGRDAVDARRESFFNPLILSHRAPTAARDERGDGE